MAGPARNCYRFVFCRAKASVQESLSLRALFFSQRTSACTWRWLVQLGNPGTGRLWSGRQWLRPGWDYGRDAHRRIAHWTLVLTLSQRESSTRHAGTAAPFTRLWYRGSTHGTGTRWQGNRRAPSLWSTRRGLDAAGGACRTNDRTQSPRVKRRIAGSLSPASAEVFDHAFGISAKRGVNHPAVLSLIRPRLPDDSVC